MTAREKQIEKVAIKLMRKFKLTRKGWKFGYSIRGSYIGQCRHTPKLIVLNTRFANTIKMSEVKDTILHEIAHALVGIGHGHDRVWRAKCNEIGCHARATKKVDYLKNVDSSADFKYVGVCPSCGRKSYRNKMPRRRLQSCGSCSGGHFNHNFIIRWRYNN